MFNILVVDDSKSVHAFIKSLKLPSELVIHSVFDGSQGLSKLNSNPKFFVGSCSYPCALLLTILITPIVYLIKSINRILIFYFIFVIIA